MQMSENRKLADNAGSSNDNKSLNDREGMVPAEDVRGQENLARRPDSVQEDDTPGAAGSSHNNEYIEIFMHEYTGSDESIVEALRCVDFFSDVEEEELTVDIFLRERGKAVLGFYRFYINNFDTPAFEKKLLNTPEGFPVILQLGRDLERTSCGMPTDMLAINEFKALQLAVEEAERRRVQRI